MSKLTIACATLLLGLCTANVRADTLPLPDSLTGFSTHDGEVDFAESDAREAYFPLASNFLTQKTQSYCGVASIVMVLNALGVPAPAVPEYTPYRTFTQDNVLSERTDVVLPRETLARQGMTLDQIGGILATQPVKAEVRHASDSSVDEFRKLASAYLGGARPFRHRQLLAQGARRTAWRAYFTACRLRRKSRPLPHPRRRAL